MRHAVLWITLATLWSAWAATPAQSNTSVPFTSQIARDGEPVSGWQKIKFTLFGDEPQVSPFRAGSAPKPRILAEATYDSVLFLNGVGHVQIDAFNATQWNGAKEMGLILNDTEDLGAIPIGSVPGSLKAERAEAATHSDSAAALTNPPAQPGVSFVNRLGPTPVDTSNLFWLEMDNLTVVAPADGYLWVEANGQESFASSTIECVILRLGESAPSNLESQGVRQYGPGERPFSITNVIPVTAGTHVIRLYAKSCQGAAEVSVFNFQAMWVPARYQP